MDIETVIEIRGWLDEFLWPEPDGRQRAKRERILASATGLFVRFGYRKTSIDEIARASGVAKGTVYLYYRNKAELVLHAIALEKSGYLDRLEPVLAAEVDPAERLRGLIALGLLGMQEMPLLSSLSGGDHELGLALSEVDSSVLARIDGWRAEFMMGLIAEAAGGALSGQALLERAQVLIDVISGVVLSGALAQKGAGLEQYAWTLAGTLVGGVAATSASLHVPATWLQPIDVGIDAPITKEAAL
jgi:AcrR family transcriptional regulator